MTFFLQNSALLWLLGLVALPLLVHLIARARPPAYRFSNIAFLRRVLRMTDRVRRPKDWLLLLLRTLALAALLAAFLGLVLHAPDASLPGEERTVVFLVDRTGSMAAREAKGIRFENACAAAARYLAASRPERANVVWLQAEPATIFPEPGPNREYLAEELQKAECRPERGALQAAFDLALRQLAQAGGHRELVVVSDFQATAWSDFTPRIPEGILVVMEKVAEENPANLAVTGLVAQPASPVVGQKVTMLARVRNFSEEPRRATLTLDVSGALQSNVLEVPAGGEAEISFQVQVAGAGMLPVHAAIERDGFSWDDQCWMILEVREALRLAVAAPAESAEGQILARAAAALPWLEGVFDAHPERSGPADFWLVPQWNGADAALWAKTAAAGAVVWVQPTPAMAAAHLGELLGDAKLRDGGGEKWAWGKPGAEGWTARPRTDAVAFSLFAQGDFGNPLAGTFRERLQIPPLTAAGAVLAEYNDGVPALAVYPVGSGAAGLFNLPLATGKSNWPAQGNFLPALAELLLKTRPATAAGALAFLESGEKLFWTPGLGQEGEVRLIGTNGETMPTTAVNAPEGRTWLMERAAAPGLYQWQVSGQTARRAAVNFPGVESDLRPLATAPAWHAGEVSRLDERMRTAEMGGGLPLWPWLLALVGVLLLAEGGVAAWNPRSKKGEHEA